MASKDNVHPIKPEDLDQHLPDAEFRMRNVPMRGVAYDLVTEARKLPGAGGYLLSEQANGVFHSVRRGVCLFYELYSELGAKLGTKEARFLGAYSLFGMAALIVQELPEPKGDNLASFERPGAGFFTVGLGPDDDLKGVLSLYLKALTQDGGDGEPLVEQPDDLLSLTRDYFVAARDQMVADSEALPPELLAQVAAVTFRVAERLELRGFSAEGQAAQPKVAFAPTLPEQIVGNVAAKRALLRYVDRLALYDAAQASNPILELGGLPATVLFDGPPGTGKSSLFRMAMTRLQQRAEQAGLPAQFVLIDSGIKDEYYGKTGKQLRERLETVRDARSLVLVFFDDIDLLVGSRGGGTDNGSDRDILTITMQFLDGITTTFLGNYQTYAATNEPTALDGALRQRFHQRELIDGPADWDDYAALLGVKLARQVQSGLVQVAGQLPGVRDAAATQAAANGSPAVPAAPSRWAGLIPGLADRAAGGVSWQELGALCVEFKAKDERFTGRPIESVTQKLLAEAADFDVPEEWFGDPARFLQKPYAEKVAMLKTLYRPITGEMIAAELEYYARSEQRYGTDSREQRVQRLADDMEAQLAAQVAVAGRRQAGNE